MFHSDVCAASPGAHAQSSGPARHADDKLTISGYLQAQYETVDTEAAPPRDRVFFRRMVLSLRAEPVPDWAGTIQFDLAPAASGGSIVVKDAFLQYVGWKDSGVTVTIGNQKLPFSRSVLVSSARRALVERSFPGDRSVGSPGRAIAIKVDGWNQGRTIFWSGALGSSLQSSDPDQIRVDGVAEAHAGWPEGVITVGRLEVHPFGETPREQGAFGTDAWRVTGAIAGYLWRNDGDLASSSAGGGAGAPSFIAEADEVRAVELSGGLRGHRLSVDAEYERVRATARTYDVTAGLYTHGEARLHKAGVEAGFMLRPRRLELVGAADVLAPATYARAWSRRAAGLSWYVAGPAVKFQVMERVSRNDHGVSGARSRATYVQAQFAF